MISRNATVFTNPVFSRRILLAGAAAVAAAGTLHPAFVGAQTDDPTLEVIHPAAGDVVTSNDLEVTVKVENFKLDGESIGRTNEDGVGHMHVLIDGATIAQLINFYADETFTVPLDGLEPGTHTLVVDLASNSHQDMADTVQQIDFEYQPDEVVPLPESNYTGDPGIRLLSPTDGDAVSAKFSVELESENFTANARLEGKQNVPGYGHYHVFVDQSMDDMDMGSPEASDASGDGPLVGLVMMPGSDSFELDLTAWGAGDHTISISPAQNDHTAYENVDAVEFTITIEE